MPLPRIIIVEDDEFAANFYQLLLARKYELIITQNGDDFFSHLNQGNINGIILDINLKNTAVDGKPVDGITIAARVKANQKTADIPVILISAVAGADEIKHLLKKSGADAFIQKPVTNYNSFLKTLDNLIWM